MVRAVVLALPRGITRLRRSPPPEAPALVGLVALAVLITVGGAVLGFGLLPPGVQVIPLLGGGLLLSGASYGAILRGSFSRPRGAAVSPPPARRSRPPTISRSCTSSSGATGACSRGSIA